MLDNFDNLQASWVTQGGKVGQLSLAYGANDMGSVMIEENVVRAAGAEYCMDEVEIVRNIEDAGFAAKRRNMHYEILGDPIFRERDVPRMLELATARDGRPRRRADELRDYAARSAAAEARASAATAMSASVGRERTRVPTCRCRSVYRAAWVLPIERAADPRRLGRGRPRPHRRASARGRAPAGRARERSRRRRASCPASSTRTRISSCRWLAGRVPPAASMVDVDSRR